MKALRHKYASESSNDTLKSESERKRGNIRKPTDQPIKISGKEVEEVGFEKIKNRLAELDELRIVLLDGLCVRRLLNERVRDTQGLSAAEIKARYSSSTDVKSVSPRIVELDLSRNLFEDWREVAAICSQLEHLRSLRLDGNRFSKCSVASTEREYFQSVFRGTKSLSLEETLLPWGDVVTIVSLFESLVTIALSGNDFGTLNGISIDTFPHTVTQIQLEHNAFKALDDITSLSSLPHLQKLVLKNNAISRAGSPSLTFPASLSDLDLSHNAIDDWPFIDALPHTFPGLTALRIAHNPLFIGQQDAHGRAQSADDSAMLALARLPALRTLNYSAVSPKDRLNAESYYLSLIAAELGLAPESDAPRIVARHPRYADLCAEYGEPVVVRAEGRPRNPNALAARLVACRFRLAGEAGAQLAEGRGSGADAVFEVELPRSLSVYSVQGVVGKHFGLQPWKLRLTWETGEWDFRSSGAAANGDEEWDSEDEESQMGMIDSEKAKREVELVPGTRPVGTWIEGDEVNIRVEFA